MSQKGPGKSGSSGDDPEDMQSPQKKSKVRPKITDDTFKEPESSPIQLLVDAANKADLTKNNEAINNQNPEEKKNQKDMSTAIENQDFDEAANFLKKHGTAIGSKDKDKLSVALDSDKAKKEGFSPESVDKNSDKLHLMKEFGLVLGIKANSIDGTHSQIAHGGPTQKLMTDMLSKYAQGLDKDNPQKKNFEEISNAHKFSQDAAKFKNSTPTAEDGAKKIAERSQTELTSIPTNCLNHAMAMTIVPDKDKKGGGSLVFTDRSNDAGPPGPGTSIFKVPDLKKIDEAFVKSMMNGHTEGVSAKSITDKIKSVTSGEEPVFIKQKGQKNDNCTIANPRSNIEGVMLCQKANNEGKNVKDMSDEDKASVKKDYKQATTKMREDKVEELSSRIMKEPGNPDLVNLAKSYVEQQATPKEGNEISKTKQDFGNQLQTTLNTDTVKEAEGARNTAIENAKKPTLKAETKPESKPDAKKAKVPTTKPEILAADRAAKMKDKREYRNLAKEHKQNVNDGNTEAAIKSAQALIDNKQKGLDRAQNKKYPNPENIQKKQDKITKLEQHRDKIKEGGITDDIKKEASDISKQAKNSKQKAQWKRKHQGDFQKSKAEFKQTIKAGLEEGQTNEEQVALAIARLIELLFAMLAMAIATARDPKAAKEDIKQMGIDAKKALKDDITSKLKDAEKLAKLTGKPVNAFHNTMQKLTDADKKIDGMVKDANKQIDQKALLSVKPPEPKPTNKKDAEQPKPDESKDKKVEDSTLKQGVKEGVGKVSEKVTGEVAGKGAKYAVEAGLTSTGAGAIVAPIAGNIAENIVKKKAGELGKEASDKLIDKASEKIGNEEEKDKKKKKKGAGVSGSAGTVMMDSSELKPEPKSESKKEGQKQEEPKKDFSNIMVINGHGAKTDKSFSPGGNTVITPNDLKEAYVTNVDKNLSLESLAKSGKVNTNGDFKTYDQKTTPNMPDVDIYPWSFGEVRKFSEKVMNDKNLWSGNDKNEGLLFDKDPNAKLVLKKGDDYKYLGGKEASEYFKKMNDTKDNHGAYLELLKNEGNPLMVYAPQAGKIKPLGETSLSEILKCSNEIDGNKQVLLATCNASSKPDQDKKISLDNGTGNTLADKASKEEQAKEKLASTESVPKVENEDPEKRATSKPTKEEESTEKEQEQKVSEKPELKKQEEKEVGDFEMSANLKKSVEALAEGQKNKEQESKEQENEGPEKKVESKSKPLPTPPKPKQNEDESAEKEQEQKAGEKLAASSQRSEQETSKKEEEKQEASSQEASSKVEEKTTIKPLPEPPKDKKEVGQPYDGPTDLPPELPPDLAQEQPYDGPTDLPPELPPDLAQEQPYDGPTDLPPDLPPDFAQEQPYDGPTDLPPDLPPDLAQEQPYDGPTDLPPKPPLDLQKEEESKEQENEGPKAEGSNVENEAPEKKATSKPLPTPPKPQPKEGESAEKEQEEKVGEKLASSSQKTEPEPSKNDEEKNENKKTGSLEKAVNKANEVKDTISEVKSNVESVLSKPGEMQKELENKVKDYVNDKVDELKSDAKDAVKEAVEKVTDKVKSSMSDGSKTKPASEEKEAKEEEKEEKKEEKSEKEQEKAEDKVEQKVSLTSPNPDRIHQLDEEKKREDEQKEKNEIAAEKDRLERIPEEIEAQKRKGDTGPGEPSPEEKIAALNREKEGIEAKQAARKEKEEPEEKEDEKEEKSEKVEDKEEQKLDVKTEPEVEQSEKQDEEVKMETSTPTPVDGGGGDDPGMEASTSTPEGGDEMGATPSTPSGGDEKEEPEQEQQEMEGAQEKSGNEMKASPKPKPEPKQMSADELNEKASEVKKQYEDNAKELNKLCGGNMPGDTKDMMKQLDKITKEGSITVTPQKDRDLSETPKVKESTEEKKELAASQKQDNKNDKKEDMSNNEDEKAGKSKSNRLGG